MIITRESINGLSRYSIDGERVTSREMELRCGMYLSWYGLESMYNRLREKDKVVLEIESDNVYSKREQDSMQGELANVKSKVAELEEKLDAIRQAVAP